MVNVMVRMPLVFVAVSVALSYVHCGWSSTVWFIIHINSSARVVRMTVM